MKLPIRTNILLKYYQFKGLLKPEKDESLSIRSTSAGPKKILIIYPEITTNHRVARFFLKSILKDSTTNPAILAKQGSFDESMLDDQAKLTYYSNDDFNWWGGLEELARQRIFKSEYDAVVDMNRQFNIQSAIITAGSRAPLRLGFKSELSYLFYNLEIRIRPESFIEKGYMSFQQLLGL